MIRMNVKVGLQVSMRDRIHIKTLQARYVADFYQKAKKYVSSANYSKRS